MELQNPATWSSTRGPFLIAILVGGLSVVGAVDLQRAIGPNPVSALAVVYAVVFAPIFGWYWPRFRMVWAPSAVEIFPVGFVGYLDTGPKHYHLIEVPFERVEAFVPAVAMRDRIWLFRFSHVRAIGRRRLQGWQPFPNRAPEAFASGGTVLRIALTDQNLATLQAAWIAWKDSPLPATPDSRNLGRPLEDSQSAARAAARQRTWRTLLVTTMLVVVGIVAVAVSYDSDSLGGVFILAGFPMGWVLGPAATLIDRSDVREVERAELRLLRPVVGLLVVTMAVAGFTIYYGLPIWELAAVGSFIAGITAGYAIRVMLGVRFIPVPESGSPAGGPPG